MAKRKFTQSELTGTTPQPESLLSRTASLGMSGLSAVGNLLDLPGSSVRDVMAGKNPVDQYLTPFSEVNRTTGRDLNRSAGLSGKKDTYGNWWGGLATEIATDPLTYLSLGGSAVFKGAGTAMAKAGIHGLGAARIASAASKAGDIAGTAGRLIGPREARALLTPRMVEKHAPDAFKALQQTSKAAGFDLVNNMDKPMGGLAKVWPLGNAGVLGTGKTGQAIARGLDTAGDAVRHFKIPGTDFMPVGDIANLVNKKAGGARNAKDLYEAYHRFQTKETHAVAGTRSLAVQWAHALKDKGHKDTDVHTLRHWIETGSEPAELKPIFDEMRSWAQEIPVRSRELGVPIYDTTQRIKDAFEFPTYNAQKAGTPKDMTDPYGYWVRQATEGIVQGPKRGGSKDFAPATKSAEHRKDWMVGVRGGSKTVSEIAQDPSVEKLLQAYTNRNNPQKLAELGFGGTLPKVIEEATRDYILAKYGDRLPEKFITTGQMKRLKKLGLPMNKTGIEQAIKDNPQLAAKLRPRDTIKGLVNHLSSMSTELRETGIFGNNPVNDFLATAVGTQERLKSAEIALNHIANSAVPKGEGVSLGKVIHHKTGIGLDAGDGKTWGAAKYLLDRGFDHKLHDVNPDTARFLMRDFGKIKGGPEEISAFLKLYDKLANVTKAAYTNLDPIRFNVRNRMSGLAANALADQHTQKSIADAYKLVRGEVIPGASKNSFIADEAARRGIQNLDDAKATQLLSEMAFAREITGGYGIDNVAQAGRKGGQLDDIFRQVPGGHPFKWSEAFGKLAGKGGTTWNPWSDWRGVTEGAEKSKFAPLAFGEDISHITESMNRLAPFWALLQKGVHPDEAARLTNLAQVGYQTRNFTQFENQRLKRAFLFYSFSKGMIPFTLHQLIEHPGGRLAQTLRAMNNAKGDNELVPQHVAETASIPVTGTVLGSKEPGVASYLTGFGMGFEDPAQFAVPSLQNAGLEAISRMNPLIKGALEGAFGTSTFQRGPNGGGRELTDLDPALGRTLANIGELTGLRNKKSPVRYPGSQAIEQILSNSPISNLLTKARTITDPRKSIPAKALNLLSGVKVTDVSPATQDRELLNRVAQIEKEMGGRTYALSYIPKERQAELSKKEREDFAVISELKRLLAQRSKERQKGK